MNVSRIMSSGNEERVDRKHSFECRRALPKGGYLLTVLSMTSGGISSHAV